ncbi:hypothetical protein MJG53_010715 [Ovis ammon polii x Ovis aries]|uniref:Uncharacterized protein n=1 Tax=Ovis ammon polii x Ovis aries TaxID=2918886 RepID=A0ACB9UUJ0_9CETA|nr:hypothetical protein MJG53_010715 [Ovis ammon polii x Ovis aries]
MEFEDKPESNGSLIDENQLDLGAKHQANGKPGASGKAKLSARQQANAKCDLPRKSLNRYTWQEIQRHNQKTDQWLVINRKVYNVTAWVDRHPGGRKVLNYYAGEDATRNPGRCDGLRMRRGEGGREDEGCASRQTMIFQYGPATLKCFSHMVNHQMTLILVRLTNFRVIECDNENTSLKAAFPKGVRASVRRQKEQQVLDWFSRIQIPSSITESRKDVFRAMHPDPDIVRLYLKPLLIGELAPEEPNQERNKNSRLVEDFQELRRTLETLNMFNANLGFFFLHLAQILILEALAWGLSPKWWNYRHFQHHVKTNIYPKDPDIDVGPLFVVGDLQPVEYGKYRIKFFDYEKQHLIFCLLSPFVTPVYFNLGSIQEMCHRRHWEDIAWAISFYIRYLITFGPFYGIFRTMVLIYLAKFLESVWIAYVTQMSHIPMKISKEENRDWFSSQVLATCNVEHSFFNDWFTGHLNFQIEHHLFPTMPRHNYHKVAPLVKSLCAKHGLPYENKPMLKAFGDILRALKKYGALWKEAYCTHPEI